MMRLITVFVFVLTANILFAQPGDMQVKGVAPGLHLIHKVAAKENWYSIGRVYNASPKDIAPFNGLSIDKPLSIGQAIKIPLNAANFSQDGSKESDEVFVPLYHIVQDKEWMYRISTNYNKVPIENLEKWNGINKDQAKAGLKLIVGYLKVKKDQSSLAAKGTSTIQTKAATIVTTPPVAKVEEKKTDPLYRADPPKEEKINNPPPVVEEKKTVVVKPVTPSTTSNSNGGYFKSQYEESGKNSNGSAGVFKSTSGWQDGKYYALINNVPVGTIVKVFNPATSKTVYAKVLGQLPEMKESIGLNVRISDAAAAELGVAANKFSLEVKY